MASATVTKIYAEVVRDLPPTEQLELAETIQEQLRETEQPDTPKFRDLKGMASHPMLGEDAQEWVTRGRDESQRAVHPLPVADG